MKERERERERDVSPPPPPLPPVSRAIISRGFRDREV